MAASFTLVLEQGAQKDLVFALKDSNNNPIDLTSWTAKLQIRETFDSTNPLLTLTSPASGLVINAGAGTITLSITAAQTTALTVERAVWDLLGTDAGGAPRRLLQGVVNIMRRVTQ